MTTKQDRLAEIKADLMGDSWNAGNVDVIDVCWLIDELKAALERERWIPVEERLPEFGDPILGVCQGGGEVISLCRAASSPMAQEQGGPEWMWYLDFQQFDASPWLMPREITHWRPLPDPPKEHTDDR